MEIEYPVRINRYLTLQGIASRREADDLISQKKVLINGSPAKLGSKVEDNDKVEVIGRQRIKQYLAYYKGRGIITHSPGEGETDVATRLKQDYGLVNVSPVGRLDKDSEGLLLLSDDGRITGPLLDPEAGHEKEYEVTVDKPINHWFVKHLEAGVNIEGYTTKPASVSFEKKNPERFFITLREGKKHQIRRMCAALGYQVGSLKRVRIMHIELGKLKPNQYRKLTKTEQNKLLHSLGLS